ncbi:MAG: YybH family protein [Bryobacteraceae bacterium]
MRAAGFVVLLGLLGCAPAPTDTRAADEAAIREADLAWSKAAGSKQLEATLGYYTADASLLPPNAPIATGRESIGKVWTQLFALPGFSVHWQPARIEVARSGDLAYSQGTYELTEGSNTDRGKYVVVWKKEPGGWKAVADMFNSDLAPPK